MRNKEGYYINDFDVIYVQGTVEEKFYRKSTKKKATKDNIRWIKKNHRDVLLKLIDKKTVKKTTLKEFGILVIENSSNKRSQNQQRDTLAKFNNHILPTFKNFALIDIRVSDIEYWQLKLLEKLSSSSVKKCREILNLVFKKALADDLISKDYCSLADNIQVSTQKQEPYTEHELRLLLEHSSGLMHTYLVLVASTGLRVGEAIGLKWEDIDLNNGFIDLKRSISKGKIVDETSLTNKTKNHQRIIPLDKTTIKVINNYRLQNENINSEWIFTNKYNSHFYDGANINKYYWKPLLAELNIQDRSMYALRHTWVSIMKNNGTNDNWLKAVGGWSQSSKVMDENYYTFAFNKANSTNNFFSHIEIEKVI